MSKFNKPAKNLAWLLLLPLIIGAITFAQNARQKETKFVPKPAIKEQLAVKTEPKNTLKPSNQKPAVAKQTSDTGNQIPEKNDSKQRINKNDQKQKLKKQQTNSKPAPDKNKEKPKIIPANVKVTLKIDKGNGPKSYLVEIEPESTVLVVLKTAGSKYGFSLRYSNHSYGAFIEEIDGVANDPANSMYWLYYINGKLANLGASSQKIKEGDDILWKYEKTE